MAGFTNAKQLFLRRFMTSRHGIPSHDAFSDLFNALDPDSLQEAMLRLARGWAGTLKSDAIAIDGQALRRSFSDVAKRSPRHLAQACAAEARMTPGQIKVDGKSNEIAALPELSEMLRVKGS